jgi:hypothetical protein
VCYEDAQDAIYFEREAPMLPKVVFLDVAQRRKMFEGYEGHFERFADLPPQVRQGIHSIADTGRIATMTAGAYVSSHVYLSHITHVFISRMRVLTSSFITAYPPQPIEDDTVTVARHCIAIPQKLYWSLQLNHESRNEARLSRPIVFERQCPG